MNLKPKSLRFILVGIQSLFFINLNSSDIRPMFFEGKMLCAKVIATIPIANLNLVSTHLGDMRIKEENEGRKGVMPDFVKAIFSKAPLYKKALLDKFYWIDRGSTLIKPSLTDIGIPNARNDGILVPHYEGLAAFIYPDNTTATLSIKLIDREKAVPGTEVSNLHPSMSIDLNIVDTNKKFTIESIREWIEERLAYSNMSQVIYSNEYLMAGKTQFFQIKSKQTISINSFPCPR